jgi:hypothetical protein
MPAVATARTPVGRVEQGHAELSLTVRSLSARRASCHDGGVSQELRLRAWAGRRPVATPHQAIEVVEQLNLAAGQPFALVVGHVGEGASHSALSRGM